MTHDFYNWVIQLLF